MDEDKKQSPLETELNSLDFDGEYLEEQARKLQAGATTIMAPCKVHIHQDRLNSMVSWVAHCLHTIEGSLLTQQDSLSEHCKRLETLEQAVPSGERLLHSGGTSQGDGANVQDQGNIESHGACSIQDRVANLERHIHQITKSLVKAGTMSEIFQPQHLAQADARDHMQYLHHAQGKDATAHSLGAQGNDEHVHTFSQHVTQKQKLHNVTPLPQAAQGTAAGVIQKAPFQKQGLDGEALRLSSWQGDLNEISEDRQFDVIKEAVSTWPGGSHNPIGSRSASRGELSSRGRLARKIVDNQEMLTRVEKQVRNDVQALSEVVQGLSQDLGLRIDDLFDKLRRTAGQDAVEALKKGTFEEDGENFDHKMMANSAGLPAFGDGGRLQLQMESDTVEPSGMPDIEGAPVVNITLDERVFVSKPNFDDALQSIRADMEDQLARLREKFEFVQQNIESKIRSGGPAGKDQIAAFIAKGYHCASCGASAVNPALVRWPSAAPKPGFHPPSPSRGVPKTPESRLLEKRRHQMALNEARSAMHLPILADYHKHVKPAAGNVKDDEKKHTNLNKHLSLPILNQKEPAIVNLGLDFPPGQLNLFKYSTRVWSPRFQARKRMETGGSNQRSGTTSPLVTSPRAEGSNQQKAGTISIGEFLMKSGS